LSASSVSKSSDSTKIVTASSDTIATSSVNATISTKWGFKVDEDGFFGTDMNKAASIPDNVKIHQKQLEMTETYTKAIGSTDDPVTALSKIWSFFSKVAGNTLDPDGNMTIGQIRTMPKSFQSNGSLLDNPISVQKTEEEDLKVNQISGKIQGLTNTNSNVLDKDAFDTGYRTFFGETMSEYGNDIANVKGLYQKYVSPIYNGDESDQQISVGELFGVFCLSEMPASADTHENIQNYYSFLKSGQDFKSYLNDTFGASYVKDLVDGMNAHFKDSNMFDTLLKEINQSMKDNYTSYLSSQNSNSDFTLKKSNAATVLQSSSKYQSRSFMSTNCSALEITH